MHFPGLADTPMVQASSGTKPYPTLHNGGWSEMAMIGSVVTLLAAASQMSPFLGLQGVIVRMCVSPRAKDTVSVESFGDSHTHDTKRN